MRRAAPAITLLLAGLAFAPGARAGGSAADALFQEGLKLFDAGKTHEACEKFEASYRLDPALGTLQNLATCHEQEGRTARAHAEFEQLAAQAAQAKQAAREALGQKHAAALAKKLSRVELRFGADANVADIQLDGAPLERAAWPSPMALDPGSHTLAFSAPGKVAASQILTVSVVPGLTAFDVPHLADVFVAPPAPTGVPLRTVGLVVGGAGIFVGLGVGGLFGGLTFAKKGAAAPHCVGKYCDAEGLSLQSTAHAYATVSTTLAVIGLAAVGAGTFLVWHGPARSAVRVTPAASPSAAGLRVDGAW